MKSSTDWYEQTLRQLEIMFQANPAVQALLVVGSYAQKREDQWSDLDIVLVVADDQLGQFFPSVGWLNTIHNMFAFEQHAETNRGTTRVCFTDGRRLDAIIATETCFATTSKWPFHDGVKVRFSRSFAVNNALAQSSTLPPLGLLAPEQFEKLVNQFWFKMVIAMHKIARNDLLIGLTHGTVSGHRDAKQGRTPF